MPDTKFEVGEQQFYLVADSDSTDPVIQLLNESETTVLYSLSQTGAVTAAGFTMGTKPVITGSKGGNAALANLITALANIGLITDSTT